MYLQNKDLQFCTVLIFTRTLFHDELFLETQVFFALPRPRPRPRVAGLRLGFGDSSSLENSTTLSCFFSLYFAISASMSLSFQICDLVSASFSRNRSKSSIVSFANSCLSSISISFYGVTFVIVASFVMKNQKTPYLMMNSLSNLLHLTL